MARKPKLGAAMLPVAILGLVAWASPTPADAQWWEQDQPQRREFRRQSQPDTQRREGKVDDNFLSRPINGPMIAVVSLNDQRVTFYDAGGRILRSPVSSGTTGYETPVGLYSIIQKNRDHVSNLYDAEMPFMQRITWSGIALHAGVVPGYPASHGCVRMPYKFAENLFEMTAKGMRVVLVRQDMSPVDFDHPALFKPAAPQPAFAQVPPGDTGERPMRLGAGDVPKVEGASAYDMLKAEADQKAAAAETATREAESARSLAFRLNAEAGRDAKFVRGAEYIKANLEAQLKYAEGQAAAAKDPASAARAQTAVDAARKRLEEADARLASIMAQPKIEAAEKAKQDAADAEARRKVAVEQAALAKRKLLPISVFVSRATQRLYVRQGFEPVLEVPVVIRDAEMPIGTTLYTAMAQAGNEVKWTALSMYVKGMEPNAGGMNPSRRMSLKSPEPTPTRVEEAKAVLDRIDIPEEARARISEVVAPGSSLIVSDEPVHKETGGGTDFIVLMSGEPQGGIAIRPKANSDRFYDDDDDRPRRRRRGGYESSFW